MATAIRQGTSSEHQRTVVELELDRVFLSIGRLSRKLRQHHVLSHLTEGEKHDLQESLMRAERRLAELGSVIRRPN